MPVSDSPSTSRRLLALLSLLQARRDWPAPALARRLAVSERTVRRDIDRLRELDYAIDATRGPDGGYRLRAGTQLPPLLFDDDQAVAVALALRTAGSLGVEIEEAAARALGTVTRMLPSRIAHRLENLDAASSATSTVDPVDPAILLRLGEAIRAHEELRFDYASPGAEATDGGPEPRRTEPHHLLAHAGRWYLIGFSAEKDDWRIHRVDRLTLRSHNGKRFDPRVVPGGDPVRFLAARFRGSTAAVDSAGAGAVEWACRGEAILHASLAAIAPYVGDGSVEQIGADRCRVVLGSWSWGSLAVAFLRFEADVSDAEPAELRSAFVTLAARAGRVANPAAR